MSGNIGGVDANIPLQAGRGVQQPNPLQQIGQFAQIQNALNANKLFPGQLQQQGIATQAQQLGLQKAQNAAAYQAVLPVVANPNFTLDDLAGGAGSAEKHMGIVTQPLLSDIADLPQAPNSPEWRQAVKSIVYSRAQTAPESAVNVLTPAAGSVDVGPAIQPTVVAPASAVTPGAVTPIGGAFTKGLSPQYVQTGGENVPTNNGQPTGAPPIANQLSPAQLATPTQIGTVQSGPNKGAPIMGTLGQFLNKTSGASPLGTGRPLPPGLRNPANLAPAEAPGGGVVTGQGPAQVAAQSATGADSAHGFQDITNQGVQARGQGAVLGNMLADAQSFTTGPQALNNFKAWAVRNGAAIGTAFGLDPKAVAANEGFDKLSAQIADAQGAGSDARLSVIQHANPGSQLSPAGADQIIRQLQGNADYLQARSNLAAGYPDKSDRAGFEKQIGGNLDPRAFQFARMTPQQKADYAKNLSKGDLAKVKSSYNWAAQHGLIGGADGG